MALTCERCKAEVYKLERCDYCGRSICFDCVKSSERVTKTSRLVICKDCWSKTELRSMFKNRYGAVVQKSNAAPTR